MTFESCFTIPYPSCQSLLRFCELMTNYTCTCLRSSWSQNPNSDRLSLRSKFQPHLSYPAEHWPSIFLYSGRDGRSRAATSIKDFRSAVCAWHRGTFRDNPGRPTIHQGSEEHDSQGSTSRQADPGRCEAGFNDDRCNTGQCSFQIFRLPPIPLCSSDRGPANGRHRRHGDVGYGDKD